MINYFYSRENAVMIDISRGSHHCRDHCWYILYMIYKCFYINALKGGVYVLTIIALQ